jgi:D-sedoheptulose 7-phosphate isomerase
MIRADATGPLMQSQIEDHQRIVAAMTEHVPLLERIADRIAECFGNGGRLYVFGNGGSAADAQHIAAELVGRFKRERRALPAIALTTDSSNLTAVANDLGYEQVFARQIQALMRPGDVAWALSVSGTSVNVIRGLETAKRIGATTIGFTGRSGGRLPELCDYCFRAAHNQSDRVQEVHQLGYHLVCDRIEHRSIDTL